MNMQEGWMCTLNEQCMFNMYQALITNKQDTVNTWAIHLKGTTEILGQYIYRGLWQYLEITSLSDYGPTANTWAIHWMGDYGQYFGNTSIGDYGQYLGNTYISDYGQYLDNTFNGDYWQYLGNTSIGDYGQYLGNTSIGGLRAMLGQYICTVLRAILMQYIYRRLLETDDVIINLNTHGSSEWAKQTNYES